MKVSKEIIERYHEGNCSPAEQELVENWLLNDEIDDLDIRPENKENIKHEIWADIAAFILKEDTATKPSKKIHFIGLVRKAAAILIFSICAIAAYKIFYDTKSLEHIVLFDNSSESLKQIEQNSFFITMGPNSNAMIDLGEGLMDFYGSILFSPKEDLELYVKGYAEKMKFKTGQTYIVLGNHLESDKIIVLNEKDVLHLPPVIQRQLITQFNI